MKKIIIATTTIIIFILVWMFLGNALAQIDIHQNKPKYYIYGEFIPYENEVLKGISDQYQIKLIRVDDDVLTWWKPYRIWDTYNKRIEAAYLKEQFSTLLSNEIQQLQN